MADQDAKAKQTIAVTMHPMWLIIKEDTVCAERTPPWGAASVEEYSGRVDRNLQGVESDPLARMNYDFSAGELEDVKALYPGLAARIKAAVERGQLGMVNGTYSQAHLHTLSLEGSVRQFAAGTADFEGVRISLCLPGLLYHPREGRARSNVDREGMLLRLGGT